MAEEHDDSTYAISMARKAVAQLTDAETNCAFEAEMLLAQATAPHQTVEDIWFWLGEINGMHKAWTHFTRTGCP